MNAKISPENPVSNKLGSETPISDEDLNEVHGGRKLSLEEKVGIGAGFLNPIAAVAITIAADAMMPAGSKRLFAAVFSNGDIPDELDSAVYFKK